MFFISLKAKILSKAQCRAVVCSSARVLSCYATLTMGWRPLPKLTGGLTAGTLPEVLAEAAGTLAATLLPCDWAAVTTHALP